MPQSDRSTPRPGRLLPWGVSGFLLALIAVIYGQTLTFGFLTYDDAMFVHDCPMVRGGLTTSGIAWSFTTKSPFEWYPLSLMSHMLDCQLFGLNAWGHHLNNVLLHAAASIGLFWVWRSMTGELWPSAFVATVFAVHPQHVESVAWVAERRDVLSGLFFVLTLAAYVGYVRHGRGAGRYSLVALALTLGLMSKAMLVTVPALLLLLDYWPLGRFGQAADICSGNRALPRQSFWWLAVEKLPLVAIALADCFLTLASHGKDSAVASTDRFANAVVASVTYLCQFFVPKGLAAFYPFPADGHPTWNVAGALALLVAVSAAVLYQRQRRPYLLVGWFWFLGMLVPVIGLVQVSAHAMADRYMYLPAIGLSVAVAWGAARLGAGSIDGRWALGGSAVLAITVLAGYAIWQTSLWRSDLSLWTHSLAVTEDNRNAEIALADALNHANRLDDAISHYRRAAQWGVDIPLLNNLGLALDAQGRYAEAAVQYRSVLQLDPKSANAYANLGMALERMGHPNEAAQNYLHAIELNPNLIQPHFFLAQLLLKAARFDEAIQYFQRVIAINREFLPGRIGLAAALASSGQKEQAIAQYRLVLEAAPDNAAVREALDQLQAGQTQPASP
jgi:protein O-mannosyl-transferase